MNINRTMDHGAMKRQRNQKQSKFTVFLQPVNLLFLQEKSDTNNCILSSVNTPSRKMKCLCGVNNDSSNACLMREPSTEIEKVNHNILAK